METNEDDTMIAAQRQTNNRPRHMNKIYPFRTASDGWPGSSPEIANRDNPDLGPCAVPEVTGDGAREVASFVPTHRELEVITKYWMKRIIEHDYLLFLTSCDSCCDI